MGKLTQVSMILLAGLLAVVLLAVLAGMSPGMILVPSPTGSSGRGRRLRGPGLNGFLRPRPALLAVYLIDLLFLLTPLASTLGLPPDAFDRPTALNPAHLPPEPGVGRAGDDGRALCWPLVAGGRDRCGRCFLAAQAGLPRGDGRLERIRVKELVGAGCPPLTSDGQCSGRNCSSSASARSDGSAPGSAACS